jgi:(4S)-4-hydroxy-5-phosphonooxypentane-2,3-dione isomerase
MAITFLARMTVKAEKEQEFVALCKTLAEKVTANEPDTLAYAYYKLREPLGYAVLESFTDEAAEERHLAAPYFTEVVDDILGCLDGTYVREYLDPLD